MRKYIFLKLVANTTLPLSIKHIGFFNKKAHRQTSAKVSNQFLISFKLLINNYKYE